MAISVVFPSAYECATPRETKTVMGPPIRRPQAGAYPAEVGELVLAGDRPAVAWRKYLGLTPDQIANAAGVPLATYLQLEACDRLREADAWVIASGLGIWVSQLGARRLREAALSRPHK